MTDINAVGALLKPLPDNSLSVKVGYGQLRLAVNIYVESLLYRIWLTC